MPRRIEITVPTGESERLVEQLRESPGIIGIRVQKGIALDPEGDVVTVDVINRGLPDVALLLARAGVGSEPGTSLTTSEPISVVSSSRARQITGDSSEATWEEMEVVIGKNSNMTANALLVMAISGVLATIGIATNALHLVLGAMLIAPGFQPVVRIALGLVAEGRGWRSGISDTLLGYAAVAAGAAAAALFLMAIGNSPLGGEASYLARGTLLSYWTTITASSVLVTLVAGIAGAVLVASNKAVLTAGVMVALALVPGAAIFGLALVAGEPRIAAAGALRWAMEAGIVLGASGLVLGWKRRSVHRRPSLF